MGIGLLFALAAGLMWGLVFVAPLLLPEYPAALLVVGRYLAFGLIALPLAVVDARALRSLQIKDWLEACKLSAIGNFLYYLCLAAAIQRAGAPLPTVIIGTLPVVIAIASNRRNQARDGLLPWPRLVPALLLIGLGIACVNQTELAHLAAQAQYPIRRYVEGALLALIALACWTWYPIRNADWLRSHVDRNPRVWATAQGLVTLPMAILGLGLLFALQATGAPLLAADFTLPLGPRPWAFAGLMGAVGLLASWVGTLCWNEASQRLPTHLAGQLIVFETLSALAYAFVLNGHLPSPLTSLGITLLIAGVWWALRIKPAP
ncbi:DMT family transporter [Roseateles koreensis]|uniref:DMT family transporter n=1 Tax=Roseateles koreensis TaxID=2987526 RepID=A0ABT5KT08_9BURK|nr:DMT family transporter [Roseateles koreensis]MDC8784912.1 DMT family transporter [Roseateles koreensis]